MVFLKEPVKATHAPVAGPTDDTVKIAKPLADGDKSQTLADESYNYCDLCDRYDGLIERQPWGHLCSDCWFYVYDLDEKTAPVVIAEGRTPDYTSSKYSKAAPLFKKVTCEAVLPLEIPCEAATTREAATTLMLDDDDSEGIPVEILDGWAEGDLLDNWNDITAEYPTGSLEDL